VSIRSNRIADGATAIGRKHELLSDEGEVISRPCNQWRSKALRAPGSTVTWGPSLSLPFTSPSLLFPSPFPTPQSREGVWGSAVSSPSEAYSPMPISNLVHFSLKIRHYSGPSSLNRLNPRFLRPLLATLDLSHRCCQADWHCLEISFMQVCHCVVSSADVGMS